MTNNWQYTSDSSREAIVRALFLGVLDVQMRSKVYTHFGHESNQVDFQKIVDLKTNLDSIIKANAAVKLP